MDTSRLVQLQTTVQDKGVASKVSELLLSQRLAACVKMVPGISSSYLWQGKEETSEEYLLIITTQERQIQAVAQIITKNHPYKLPEIICLPVSWASEEYEKWVIQETT